MNEKQNKTKPFYVILWDYYMGSGQVVKCTDPEAYPDLHHYDNWLDADNALNLRYAD